MSLGTLVIDPILINLSMVGFKPRTAAMRSVALSFLVVIAFVSSSPSQIPSKLQNAAASISAEKLGAHQLGGRGCLGCHILHTAESIPSSREAGTRSWSAEPLIPSGTEEHSLWAEDIGPILELSSITTGDDAVVDFSTALTTQRRILTGVVFCLSCHDGDVARGAMMTNQSFQQATGMLPASYGFYPIPTLLGNDGSASGNYRNDHPIGQQATVAALGPHSVLPYVAFDSPTDPSKLVLKNSQSDSSYISFQANYGLPSVLGNRSSGMAVDSTMSWPGQAYVVCTTCHTPHSMFETTATQSNPIAGRTSGTFQSYFFIAAPFNPGVSTYDGRRASSAVQFCRQCHFADSGGANEYAGISIPTAF